MEDLKDIFDSTEVGQKIIIRETTETEYVRTKSGLRLVKSKTLDRKTVDANQYPHLQSQSLSGL